MNAWVYDRINNGVYKTGFAANEMSYGAHVIPLFQALDRVQRHLQNKTHHPNLFEEYTTEADIRLFTTLMRFDAAYFTLLRYGARMIRDERPYPRLHWWLRDLVWGREGFRDMTDLDSLEKGT